MARSQQNSWYGYTHRQTGTEYVKTYKANWQLVEARRNPFYHKVIGPFVAVDADSAMKRYMEKKHA